MLLRTVLIAGAAGAAALSFVPQAHAASEYYAGKSDEPANGPYVGASIGQSRFDNSFSINDLDRKDKSWKGLVGWRFANQFAVEGSYVDFGKSTAPGALGVNPFAQEAKAWMLQGVGFLPIPYVDLF